LVKGQLYAHDLHRFIQTPILPEQAIKTMTTTLQGMGSDWALVEDSAKAVLRLAADKSINGMHRVRILYMKIVSRQI
jgi:hypothetical protein